MIFNRKGRERFLDAVTGVEAAVEQQDSAGVERAFQLMNEHYQGAGEQELATGAVRLAGLLSSVPPGPRGAFAVVIGACVERGADPRACAPAILDGLADAVRAAGEFCERWAATGGGELPDPEGADPERAVFERVGFERAMAWWTLPQWEMASVAMLNHPSVRTGLDAARRAELLTALRAVEEASGHDFKCLTYALLVLDDEPLIVIDRPSGTGYALRMTGLGDTFQLHTLLADRLAGGGHLPGYVPTPREVAVCRDAPGQVPTKGTFNLVAPDGGWIWNEGTPSDIPVVEGSRLLVLDPPPYERGWPAGRFFPGMTGDLVLERVLTAEETARWSAHVLPAGKPGN
ncbi:hypothetical protein V2W30_35945 [Streptomyces sp. Q6]|uniref:Uncharacterized protein n=1 Tax=Streptomyces citrinus TaxID=3118173 RepID=A0ACD5ALU0_9ACTN